MIEKFERKVLGDIKELAKRFKEKHMARIETKKYEKKNVNGHRKNTPNQYIQ